ncbi:MAG: LD-carboxypeptidase [Pseudomonadota bacterium]
MQRRQFLTATAAALTWASVGPVTAAQRSLIKAPALRRGDRVGLVNPATAAFKRAPIEVMQEALESLGLEVVLGEHFYDRLGYFAGEDEARAADINGFFTDPSVRMIFARGGWGSARLLPLLDYEAIAQHPKILMGYSDATALINGVHQRTGLVTFHGPSPLDRFSAEYFQRVVMAGEAVTMRNPTGTPRDTLVPVNHRIRSLRGGKAQGPLLGGNLTVLTAIVGSSYVPDFDGAILFLEDVGEAVYRVDRMLTQLKLAGILDRLAGVVFGRCTDCGPGTDYGSLTLEEVLERHFTPLGVPAFSGSMIGHIPKQFVLPLGLNAQIDADLGTIRLLESAVAPAP